MDDIEARIRNLKLTQLEVLKQLATSNDGILDQEEIMDATHTSSYTFGALVGSLKKFKDNVGQPLIKTAGETDKNGMRWQLNEKVIDKIRLLEILADMKI